jgi:hypothetical protein
LPYTDNPERYSRTNNSFAFRIVDGVGWVGYNLGTKPSDELSEKFEGRAKSIGLLGSLSIDEPPTSFGDGYHYKKNDGAVWIVGVNLAYEYESRNRQ